MENQINLYTIHDCFASTLDTMEIIEILVRESFADMYFGNKTYINVMHENFINQIKSFVTVFIDDKKQEYIIVDEKRINIPNIPISIIENFEQNLKILRSSVIKSAYIIN
uniref:DNA-directed RNA polymerase n=1 Tax=Tuber calosporum TaxID=1894963 RepID=A0A7S6VIM8_9PEZI|nr:DNA-directed RNA polymerase [Tuber calosporum]QOW39570.1 DNA-directed RNA polymerase [Tuber calosporum]